MRCCAGAGQYRSNPGKVSRISNISALKGLQSRLPSENIDQMDHMDQMDQISDILDISDRPQPPVRCCAGAGQYRSNPGKVSRISNISALKGLQSRLPSENRASVRDLKKKTVEKISNTT